jgi:hypothetical protein
VCELETFKLSLRFCNQAIGLNYFSRIWIGWLCPLLWPTLGDTLLRCHACRGVAVVRPEGPARLVGYDCKRRSFGAGSNAECVALDDGSGGDNAAG